MECSALVRPLLGLPARAAESPAPSRTWPCDIGISDRGGDRMSQKIRNQRLSDEEFFRIRKEEVLPQWETGKDDRGSGRVHRRRQGTVSRQEPRAQAQGGRRARHPPAHAPVRPGPHRVHHRGTAARGSGGSGSRRRLDHLLRLVHAQARLREGRAGHRTEQARGHVDAERLAHRQLRRGRGPQDPAGRRRCP